MTETVGFLVSGVDSPVMDGSRVVAVAFLLCVASFAGLPAGATTQEGEMATQEQGLTVVSDENTSEYLAPPEGGIDRSGQQNISIDVAGAVSANAGEVQLTYLRVSTQRAYRDAQTDAERRAMVNESARKYAERVDRFESTEQRAIERYRLGEISERELLRTLSVVSQKATTLSDAVEQLETRASNLGMDETAARLSTDQVRLARLDSPVRNDIGAALDGERTVRVHVESSGDALVLVTVERSGVEPTYVREAHNPSAKTVNIGDRYNSSPLRALDRIEELYPWVIDNDDGISATAIGTSQVRVYRFIVAHPHGQLEAHLDGGSGNILREVQRKNVGRVPTTTIETTEGDLTLRLNTTRAGGPLGISTIDDTTGERLDARVTVNNDRIGSTGGRELWTVAPRGTVAVNVTHNGRTVTIQTNLE
ncbi:hypothetical protein [Natronomonas sp.]|uniref:DUF7096 domain-containing protein n=2 Tax=Natronomonas sp. TaxID=2184060 RepID=UPI00398A431C